MIESQKKLTAAKRLSDIGALAAVVAHELRTPLSVIRVAAYNLRRKSSNGHLVEHIARIEKKVFEANQIIDNLLFYSRIKTPVFKKVNVRSLLEECVAEAKVRFSGEPVRIVKEWKSTKHFFAKADPLQIKEVFHNLLTNAVEVLPIRGGGIEIGMDSEAHGRMLRITCKDNGCGISEENISKIHEPFFTTKSQGTGLGLPVCRQIVLNHGGTMDVVSQKGEGALFTVTLPLWK